MEEERCFRCDRSKEEVRLIDAVYDNEIVKICEECAFIENIPVIRKPTSFQLKESEKPYTVHQRLSRMAGLKEEKEEGDIKKLTQHITLDSLRKKDYKAILDEKFSLAKKKNKPLNLVDNYNWHILMARKKRKMSRKQLADSIGEPETAIKMIEDKELVDDASRIITKIEQYFGIKLKKESENDSYSYKEEKAEEKKPAVILKFDPETTKNITLDDLKRMKEEREKLEQNTGRQIKKEIDISELVWRAKKEGKTIEGEKENLTDAEIEFED